MPIPSMQVATTDRGVRIGNFNARTLRLGTGEVLLCDPARFDALYVDEDGRPSEHLVDELKAAFESDVDVAFVDEPVYAWVQKNWRGDKSAFRLPSTKGGVLTPSLFRA